MRVVSGRARLAVESHGSGGRDVLLLHAGVTDQRSWRAVRGALRGHARCLSFDARGFGRTEFEPEPGWSPVADAVAVLTASGVGRAVVVGASLGGRTAVDLALTRPDLVSGLVLVGPAISGAPQPELDEPVREIDEALDAADERGDLDTVNQLEARLWLDGPHAPEGRVSGATRELFLEMNGAALRAADPGPQGGGVAAWDRLREISAPTLLLVGELDLRHLRDSARRAAELMPAARVVELPGVAHLPHLEGDPLTLRAIADFVRRG